MSLLNEITSKILTLESELPTITQTHSLTEPTLQIVMNGNDSHSRLTEISKALNTIRAVEVSTCYPTYFLSVVANRPMKLNNDTTILNLRCKINYFMEELI